MATGNLAPHSVVGEEINHYMQDYHISTLFRNLLQDLIKEKPDNPIQFLMERIQNFVTHKVVIIGPPAAGKGTQCEMLVNRYGMSYIGTGDLLRAEVAKGSKLGQEVKQMMDAGVLVPDNIMNDLVCQRILEADCVHNGWILDGYPRTMEQARALRTMGIEPDLIIVLQVPEEEIEERITGRWSDPVTGKIYHLKYNPPPANIRGRLVQRLDDSTEKVKAMLDAFHANTDPVLRFYDPNTVLEVDGMQGKLQVFRSICASIDEHGDRRTKRGAVTSQH